MADIKGLLNDNEFKGLDVPTQKQVLGKIDPDFASLSDEDFNSFKTRLSAPPETGLATATPTGISPGHGRSLAVRALQAAGANPNTFDKIEDFGKGASQLTGQGQRTIINGEEVNASPVFVPGAPEGLAASAISMGRKAMGVAGGLLTGYATHKTAKELGAAIGFPGAGEALGEILGAVVGGKVAGAIAPEAAAQVESLLKTKGIGAVRSLVKSWVTPASEAEGGFRVNPAILKKTAFGGPGPVEYGSVGRPERVGKALVPTPVEDTRFVANPNIAKKMQFGGPPPPEYGAVGRPEIVGNAVPSEPQEPVEDTRFRVNPKIAAKMKYGGPAPVEYGTLGKVPTRKGQSGGAFVPPSRGTSEDPVASVTTTPTAATPALTTQPTSAASPGHEAFLNPESSGLQIPQEQNARTAVAQGLAKKFKANGITADQIDALRTSNPAEYNKLKINAGKLATQLGVSKQAIYSTSDATMERVMEILRGGSSYKLPEIPKK